MKSYLFRVLSFGAVFAAASSLLFWFSGCASPQYRGYKCAPYTLRGVYYEPLAPKEAVGYEEIGTASHYHGGSFFFKGTTAIGEKLGSGSRSAAHKTLPLPCKIRVTNLENGRSAVLRVNDRGPFIGDRILDVTTPVAKDLGFYRKGLARVRIKVLSVGDGKYRID